MVQGAGMRMGVLGRLLKEVDELLELELCGVAAGDVLERHPCVVVQVAEGEGRARARRANPQHRHQRLEKADGVRDPNREEDGDGGGGHRDE